MTRIGWVFVAFVGGAVAMFALLIGWGGVHFVDRQPRPGGSSAGTIRNAIVLPAGVLLAIPVQGIPREAIQDSWGDPRDNGQRAHHGTDIPAAPGTPVIAAAQGIVEKLHESAAGGTTLYVRSPKRRWVYYYAHLASYAPGVHEGQRVRVGDPLGFVGDTGNAGAGNYHLHFGLALTRPDERWYQGVDLDPYPLLAGKPAGG